jgi:ATP-dependent helicase/nuclease subunit A
MRLMSSPHCTLASDYVPPDQAERERALAPDKSIIVRAPAGSGKTELLTQRFLKLLATVEEPEEILAITFTRAATAEMRRRILCNLKDARQPPQPGEDTRITLARAALTHAEARGWRLLEQPHRLNVETIDSLCLRIAHGQPLLSRMGGRLAPTEQAGLLHTLAARRTLAQLGCEDRALNHALVHLLSLRDNNLSDCEKLIANMLADRDGWVDQFPLASEQAIDWTTLRARLEEPFQREVQRVLAQAHRLLFGEHDHVSALFELARHACEHGNSRVALLSPFNLAPDEQALTLEHWRCICHFLLTEDKWRSEKGLRESHGFLKEHKREKSQMGALIGKLSTIDGLREALCAISMLPKPHYDEDDWQTLRHLFVALRRAVAELRVVFAERNEVDFTEIALATAAVLDNPELGSNALLAISGNISHLLVDEFQDTSRSQHRLLSLLVRAWEAGDRRTCFFVGDPMQSVYRFRQAEVELFHLVARHGLGDQPITFTPVTLSTNFRSHAGLTTRWNSIFTAVFNSASPRNATRIEYTKTIAAEPALPGEAVRVYPQRIGTASARPAPEDKRAARKSEADQVIDIIEQHRGRIDQARANDSEYRVAVLVRARPHLARIVPLLRERGIPFRAVELETLNERQELVDLLSLMRALLHPMDRIAWLSVLRAPWCGLTLDALHILTGSDSRDLKHLPVIDLIERIQPSLGDEDRQRLGRVADILRHALASRYQGMQSFSQWIERTWRSLGGPLTLDTAACNNAQVFFKLLDRVPPAGIEGLTEDFEAELGRLYAQPDPSVSERAGVQLMTIHKAKGLGFDVVIVPGLDLCSQPVKSPLIVSLQRIDPQSRATDNLIAPIGRKGDDKRPTYAWVRKQIDEREREERKRLLYVACTRARRELHLLGTAEVRASGLMAPAARSLLETAWPALASDFAGAIPAVPAVEPANVIPFPQPHHQGAALDLAAAAEAEPSLKPHSLTPHSLTLRRLPLNIDLTSALQNVTFTGTISGAAEIPFTRPEGSRRARIVGSTVHALLEELSSGLPRPRASRRARVLLRAAALDDALPEVLAAIDNVANDPDGAWILAAHAGARSESSWTRWSGSVTETLRADRVFRAGASPRQSGEGYLWIVDYKMASPSGEAVQAFLARQREIYAPQLTRYAEVVRAAEAAAVSLRLGIYYPRIPRLDWWAAENSD